MKKGIIVLVVLVLLLLWFGGAFVSHRNEMVRKREAVNAAWSQVDVVLQRRADLIPNLVETVKGFATHEEKVFGDIAAARAAMMGAKSPRKRSLPMVNLIPLLVASWSSWRIILNSGLMKIFCGCRTSLRALRTGQPSNAAAITKPCRITTRISVCSRTTSSQAFQDSRATTLTSRQRRGPARFQR